MDKSTPHIITTDTGQTYIYIWVDDVGWTKWEMILTDIGFDPGKN
jgi:hypothetical protein